MRTSPSCDAVARAILRSYRTQGGINHIEGPNLPSRESIIRITETLRSILFPGFYEEEPLSSANLARRLRQKISWVRENLAEEVTKSLRYAGPEPGSGREKAALRRADAIVKGLLEHIPALRRLLRADIEAAFAGDPAAKSREETILAYPGVAAITVYRVAHFLWQRQVPLIPRIMTEHMHQLTGIDIHPGARVGERFFIDHGTGVVIGETTVIGRNVKLYQGVTLGALSVRKALGSVKRHPTIEDDVTIYAGATILGGKTVVGRGSVIGGNVWLVESVPPRSKVYIEPRTVVARSQSHGAAAAKARPRARR